MKDIGSKIVGNKLSSYLVTTYLNFKYFVSQHLKSVQFWWCTFLQLLLVSFIGLLEGFKIFVAQKLYPYQKPIWLKIVLKRTWLFRVFLDTGKAGVPQPVLFLLLYGLKPKFQIQVQTKYIWPQRNKKSKERVHFLFVLNFDFV